MRRILSVIALILGAAATCCGSVTVQLVSFDGPVVIGIPTYPYTLAITGLTPFDAMCDDYYHDGTPGDRWSAYINNLASPNLAEMRFGSQGIVPYEEAGWILLQTASTPSSQWPDMNFAVWRIFNPTTPDYGNAQFWIDQAAANYQGVDYDEVYIATPVDIDAPPTGDQEFLFLAAYPPEPPVPEPGTLALFGIGFAAASIAVSRKWMN